MNIQIPLRCCCDPTKVLGSLPMHTLGYIKEGPVKFLSEIDQTPVVSFKIGSAPDSASFMSVHSEISRVSYNQEEGSPLYSYRDVFAIKSKDIPLDVWRKVPGFMCRSQQLANTFPGWDVDSLIQKFKSLLRGKMLGKDVDIEDEFLDSKINHHAKGLDYYCLFRSEKLTLKIYHIHNYVPANAEHRWLVNPHNHRYFFRTVVLRGKVRNIVFSESKGNRAHYKAYRSYYDYKTKDVSVGHQVGISVLSDTLYSQGQYYDTYVDQIHTIVPESDDLILGIVQFEDINEYPALYLPHRFAYTDYKKSIAGPTSVMPKAMYYKGLADLSDKLSSRGGIYE